MKRLIRKDSTTDYCSVWTRGLQLVVHAGRVGDRGKTYETVATSQDELQQLFANQIASAQATGFRELSDSDVQDVVVQFADPEFPADELLAHRYLLEERASESLGWVGDGYCTGGDIGPNRVNVWCKVIDPEIAAEVIISDLEDIGLSDGVVVARRSGSSYEVLYPFEYPGPFRV